MLNKKEAIRIDRRDRWGHPTYVFKCSTANCLNEISASSSVLRTHTGRCGHCANLARHGEIKPFISVYRFLAYNAKRRNLPFSLSYEFLIWLTENIGTCRYCGEGIKWKDKRGAASNLDRKDNTKGYSDDNVVVCCSACNRTRSNNFTDEEFLAVTQFLRTWRSLSHEGRKSLEYAIYDNGPAGMSFKIEDDEP